MWVKPNRVNKHLCSMKRGRPHRQACPLLTESRDLREAFISSMDAAWTKHRTSSCAASCTVRTLFLRSSLTAFAQDMSGLTTLSVEANGPGGPFHGRRSHRSLLRIWRLHFMRSARAMRACSQSEKVLGLLEIISSSISWESKRPIKP